MKKKISFILAFLLFISLTSNVDAKKMNNYGCKTKNYTKTCNYGYSQSDVGKLIVTKYRKNWTMKQKTIQYYSPLVWKSIVYKYNSKGQLKSNKYGKASRYTKNYYTNHMGKNMSKLLLRKTELKVYNSKGKTKSKFYKNYSLKKNKINDLNVVDYYYTSYFSQAGYYKYNSKGQLKSNKHGKAYRVISKYNEKGKRVSKVTHKYNASGK